MFRRMSLVGALVLGLSGVMQAQTQVGVASRLAFDISAPTLADAQGYTYRSYLDDGAGTVVGVGCENTPQTGVFACTATNPIPALTLGPHTIRVSASNAAGEGPLSVPFTFTVIAVPNAPGNVRLVP